VGRKDGACNTFAKRGDPMIWGTTEHGHLFVFWNGKLIYKRRDPRGGHGLIFDPFGPPWMPEEMENDSILKIREKMKLSYQARWSDELR
jgi:hypothetical protein